MTLNTPQYTIRIRDNTLAPQGALSAWDGGDIMLRMNDVGKWALTVKADDPLRSIFATRGAGIIVSRDRGDGSGAQVIMSGPIWSIERRGTDNTYVLAGPTDEWWLKARRALPAGGRPYMEQVLLDSPVRFYRLGEASGTVAADTSLQKINGIITNAPTLGATGAIPGDPNTAITLVAASSQRVTGGNAAIPTGNNPISFEIWHQFASNPASVQFLMDWGAGTRALHANWSITLDTSGHVNLDVGAGSLITSGVLATGAYHHIVTTWDGTTAKLYVDNTLIGSATPGAQATTATTLTIGCTTNATQFYSGQVDEGAVYNTALTAAQVAAHFVAGTTAHSQYDTRTGQASNILLLYTAANLTNPVNIDRDLAVMSTAADPAVGTTVTGNARGDELLTLLQQLASAGGDIGFRVVQISNSQLQFQVYQPTDRTGNAKFSQDLQNLFDFAYSLAGPNANSVMVWGGGVGTGRTSVLTRDAASVTNWGLVEGFIDARDTSDTITMNQRGQAEINAQSEQTNLALTPRDTDTVQFGRDYNLGDIVAVQIDGNTITNKIRSVHIQLQSPDEEIITPGIGNPSQGEVARWFDAYAARTAALNRVQQALNRLSAAQ